MPNCLDIRNVSFNYKNRPVLKDVSLTVDEKDYIAIIGPNGSGKSTLLKLIMGILKPDSGSIEVFGQPVEKGRDQVGYLSQFQHVDINYPISVLDVVLMSVLSKKRRPTAEDRTKALHYLEKVGVANCADRPISDLSGGQRQRVYLARSLMKEPQLLILDEPTCNIDQPSERHFYEILDELNQKMAIIVVSHDVSAVAKSAKKIGCLNKTLTVHQSHEITQDKLADAYCCHVNFIHDHDH